MLREDLELFFRKIQHAYGACTQAVDEQLARCQGADLPRPTKTAVKAQLPANGTRANGKAAAVNGNGFPTAHKSDTAAGRASPQQVRYARQLAAQIPGLGLEKLSAKLLHKPLARLSAADASVLIETLRNILSGEADLDALLEDAPTAAE